MIVISKNRLFTMVIASVLTLAGCASNNKLIVPDGSKRVPINRDTSTHGASTHQDQIAKHD